MVIQTPILTGSKEIARYVGRPWNTVRKWIASEVASRPGPEEGPQMNERKGDNRRLDAGED